jgi:hypothetical protein
MRGVERSAYRGRGLKASETFGPVMTAGVWRARRAPRPRMAAKDRTTKDRTTKPAPPG